MISAYGLASSTIFNLGPGRLGTLLESIAIPEIRQQAVEIATILAGRVFAAQHHRLVQTASDQEAKAAVPTAA